jgi:hypothetical protein
MPIRRTVRTTLSPPIRIFAFVGVLAAVGIAASLFLLGRSAGETEWTPSQARPAQTETQPRVNTVTQTKPAARPVTAEPARKPAVAKPRKRVLPAEGFPLPVRRALRANRVAVVVVYTPGASVDAFVRAEARAAAKTSRAGLVSMSGLSERLVRPLVAKTGVLPNPAVVVVKRSGVVAATLGVTDRQTITQTVAQAKR